MERTQCRFKRKNSQTVAWIPSKAAKIGNWVELLTLDGQFWRIISVGATSTEDMSRRHKTFKNNI